jgi:mannose-6-phosphate isomerase-like protein (cupin superfamily)
MTETTIAPDGSAVTPLGRIGTKLSTARFVLAGGEVSRAVVHRTVAETWAVQSGRGRIWLSDRDIVDLRAGDMITIRAGTAFQFRADGPDPVVVLGTTVPAWPLDEDAAAEEATVVDGPWVPTV